MTTLNLYLVPRRPQRAVVVAEHELQARLLLDAAFSKNGQPPLQDIERLTAVPLTHAQIVELP